MTTKATVSAEEKWSLGQAVSKALKRNNEWDKDELLDVIYWGRQIISLAVGIIWGLLPLRGFIAFALYLGISAGTGHLYVTSYQNQDDESFGGFWELAKEGFGAAFATFMIAWITVHSAVHFD
ncbi:rab5-interacting protein [Aphelenchoides avenae]|nr:rab5-interacting protein [Aphelenchus avenae]